MKEIVIVAPYKNLYKTAARVIEKNSFDNVDVVMGDLYDGMEQAEMAIERGASIIISRGGTYSMIKESLPQIPVVELEISAYDIMSGIKHIIVGNEPMAILGFNNIIYGYDLLEGFKEINIHKIDLDNGKSIADKINECVKDGITSFMGDTIVAKTCKQMGYNCYLIESGESSVLLAINRAEDIIKATKNEIERTKRYDAIIDFVRDGIIATDENMRVLAYNNVAKEIFGVQKENIVGENINDILPELSSKVNFSDNKMVNDEIKKIKSHEVTLTKVPIIVRGENKGAVAVFQDITNLQDFEKKIRTKLLGKGFEAKYTFEDIIYKSSSMEKVINIARKFANYNSSVLIQGESGVGKELFAQSVHNGSSRKKGPFVAVNCAALPPSLIESELFGYEEGAFTGSKRGGRAGMFEMAHNGTIFLDEISEIPLDIQGRLLRVIQEREIMRLGDNKVIPLDIRIVSATNKDLKKLVSEGKFRQDLLFRINTLTFTIPPLCNRKEDIVILGEMFMKKYCKRYSKKIVGFSKGAINYITNYQYQGNVRELQGKIERAVIVCESDIIKSYDLYDEMENSSYSEVKKDFLQEDIFEKGYSLKELSDKYIEYIYKKNDESVAKTCSILKIDRTTLWRKLKK